MRRTFGEKGREPEAGWGNPRDASGLTSCSIAAQGVQARGECHERMSSQSFSARLDELSKRIP